LRMIDIVVIDSNEEDLLRIQKILSSQEDFTVVATGIDGYDALRLVQMFKPDVTVSEIDLEFINGAEMVPLLKRASPSTKILIFTGNRDEKMMLGAIRGEVAGFLLKENDLPVLPRCIRTICNGNCFFTPLIANSAIRLLLQLLRQEEGNKHPPKTMEQTIPSTISKRELQVMGQLAEGRTNKEIAEILHLKVGTVRNCISQAIQKSGLHDRTQIALYAFQNGLNKKIKSQK